MCVVVFVLYNYYRSSCVDGEGSSVGQTKERGGRYNEAAATTTITAVTTATATVTANAATTAADIRAANASSHTD